MEPSDAGHVLSGPYSRVRGIVKWSLVIAVVSVASVLIDHARPDRGLASSQLLPDNQAPPRTGLAALKAGNERFAAGHRTFAHLSHRRLDETEAEQHPFAIVLGCSDSRVPVEHLFDVGIGDLFVVRVAGNISSDDEEGSIEYAIEHLSTKLLVVLGHTDCGAVTAVVDHAETEGHIPHLTEHIEPAYLKALHHLPHAERHEIINHTVRTNVAHTMEDLLADCALLRERVESGDVLLVGGVYDLKTGLVDWLDAAEYAALIADIPLEAPVAESLD